MKSTTIARRLAARRRTETKPCTVCGGPMTGLLRKLYCGRNCKQKAVRKRNKAELLRLKQNQKD